jgi:predicted NUDIX family NTP pyrophosphohydrolase
MKQSAGTLLYRHGPEGLEVLLVHPSGAYNRHAPWGIPKGLPSAGETPDDLQKTARRETLEETGIRAGDLVPLGDMVYRKSRKRVHCFAGPAPSDAEPHIASWEVDQVQFLPLARAREVIHPDQAVFLDRLVDYLRDKGERTDP